MAIITTAHGDTDERNDNPLRLRRYKEINDNSFYDILEINNQCHIAAREKAAREEEQQHFKARIAKVTELSTKGYGTKSIANIMQIPEHIIAEDLVNIARNGGFVTIDDLVPSLRIDSNTNTNSYHTNHNIDRIKRYTASVSPHTNSVDRIADDILAKYHSPTDSMPEDISRQYRGMNPAAFSGIQAAYNRLLNNNIKSRELRRRVEGKRYDADTQWGREEDRMEQIKRELAILNGGI
jgi:hypothetical protein